MIHVPQPGLATEKLFHRDPALRRATARVTFVEGDAVALDRTILYADSGGQVADRGRVGGLAVADVSKQGGRPVKVERGGLDPIYVNTGTYHLHRLEGPAPFAVGDEVELELDWEHRWQVMRHHTAAHFVFHAIDAVLQRRSGARILTRGCVIRDDACRFDIANALSADHLAEVQDMVDGFLDEDREVVMRPDPACDDVFHWSSAGVDIPCGGTHVPSTGAVGRLRLSRRAKGRNTTRIAGELLPPGEAP